MKEKKVIVSQKGEIIEIRPFTKIDLAEYFDRADAELKSDLSEWHKVRKELRRM